MGEGDELKQSSGFRRQRQLEGANVLGLLVLIFLYPVVCLATAACRVSRRTCDGYEREEEREGK